MLARLPRRGDWVEEDSQRTDRGRSRRPKPTARRSLGAQSDPVHHFLPSVANIGLDRGWIGPSCATLKTPVCTSDECRPVAKPAVDLTDKVALVTGAARRIGAVIARILHSEGMRIAVHYHHSAEPARELKAALNSRRDNSMEVYPADLRQSGEGARMVEDVVATWGRLDLLINNASSFYPTPLGTITEDAWNDLIGTNLKAPLFLSPD